MKFQDYYATLGVARDAAPEAIQKAYRQLARKLHPDVNKQPGAEQRFKEVTEAYEVLKDPAKRSRYDALGPNWKAGQDFRPPPEWQGAEFDSADGRFEDLGGDFSSFFEAFFGSHASPFGGRGATFGGRRSTRPRQGSDQEAELTLELADLVRGEPKSITLEDAAAPTAGGRRSFSVRIPPGTVDGTVIRLAGQGQPGAHGGPPGDLLLRVRLAPHARLRVRGHDLECDLPVSPWEAALGGKVPVGLVQGEASLSVPPGTSSGTRLRLRGQGLPRSDGGRGDLHAVVSIQVPATLDDDEQRLFRELQRVSRFSPR